MPPGRTFWNSSFALRSSSSMSRYFVCRSTLLYDEAADADEADEVVEAVDGERDGTADEVVEDVDELVWWCSAGDEEFRTRLWGRIKCNPVPCRTFIQFPDIPTSTRDATSPRHAATMNKLFCFALLFVACLASFASGQTYTRQLPCRDYTSCLCSSLPRMIAAANGRQATATLVNPTTGLSEVFDLSRPMSGALRARCARIQARPL
uniref:Uncharacterized protein n=1 Tax=Anopheles atroparvus TaxID=41427 RepID=A0A182JH22_ANOAO